MIMTFIYVTTKQQISVYSILIVICLLVPAYPHLEKNCTPHFSKCRGYKFFFRSRRFVPLTFKIVAPPLRTPDHYVDACRIHARPVSINNYC